MTNREKLQSYVVEQKRPLIIYNVETTGCMDGGDNRITQVALAAYEYNRGSDKYELQDHMFMLAKPNEPSLKNIEDRKQATEKNITSLLQEEYLYNYTHEVKRDIKNCQNRQKTLDGKISKAIAKYGAYSSQVDNYQNRLKEEIALEQLLTRELSEKEVYVKEHEEDLLKSWDCQEYIEKHFDRKKEELEEGPSLKEILSSQGINLDTWRKGDAGLSFGEIQIGIDKFLKSYEKDNTVVMSNGTYFAKHYMDKERLKLNTGKEEIDIPKTLGQTDWTYSLTAMSTSYFQQTGKTIQHFDALTKVLCMAEMVGSHTGIAFQNTSKKYLEEQVKWEAAKGRDKDYEEGDYVITMSQLERSHIVMDIPRYNKDVPTFNSLEYIDFGSERRYVDLDRMFEMNNNFEITLEGEKEPIKTWEELEAKIKALNGEISPELLDRIHEKYEQIKQKAWEEYSFSESFYEQENTSEDEEDYDEEVDMEEYLSSKEMSNLDKMLARLFAKNEELEKLHTQSIKMSEELQQKEEALFHNKLKTIVQDLVALQNVFQSVDCKHLEIPSESLERYFYNVNSQNITISKALGDDINSWSKPVKDKFLKDVFDPWDKIYERILTTLEKQVEAKMKQNEKLVEKLQKSLEEIDNSFDLEM